jgi:large subunit ribosomal protein L30
MTSPILYKGPLLLRVTLVRCGLHQHPKIRETLRALGLRKINQTIVHKNIRTVRGMINRVSIWFFIELIIFFNFFSLIRLFFFRLSILSMFNQSLKRNYHESSILNCKNCPTPRKNEIVCLNWPLLLLLTHLLLLLRTQVLFKYMPLCSCQRVFACLILFFCPGFHCYCMNLRHHFFEGLVDGYMEKYKIMNECILKSEVNKWAWV